MDRRVKERLVGASILAVLVVLIVPELLSGPAPGTSPAAKAASGPPDPIRNVTIDLATSKSPAATCWLSLTATRATWPGTRGAT